MGLASQFSEHFLESRTGLAVSTRGRRWTLVPSGWGRRARGPQARPQGCVKGKQGV